MIPPGGGPRDSLPPVLVFANPKDSAINFQANRIMLYFNEYVEVQNTQENVLVSPYPKIIPTIDSKLHTVSVRLRDTLEANTTYSINFGNSIRDINEGNIFKDFTYVFSTGSTIDSNELVGRVILAETGQTDSTLVTVLHRNLDDSAVAKERPRYVARVDGQGNFRFTNLPSGTFALYALPNDYSKKYDDTTKPFAFLNAPIIITPKNEPVTLYAYQLPKTETAAPARTATGARGGSAAAADKALRFSNNLENGRQDILKDFVLNFNRKIKTFDSTGMQLTDKDFKRLNNYSVIADTNQTTFTVKNKWTANASYNLVINKTAFTDSAGVTLARNDTIKFVTKKEEDYGLILLRFTNLDLSKNPVLLFMQSGAIKEAVPLTQKEFRRKLFEPGEYELRVLFDTNKNGKWDAGNFFGEKKQPEVVKDLKIKLAVRGNWDNERNDIAL